MVSYLKEIWRRRDLIVYLTLSQLKGQHKNTFLGYFWWLLDPFLGVLIYYFVVVVVFNSGGENYGIFLVVGMIVWRWFNSSINVGLKSIISAGGIITQIYLPKAIFPVSASLTQLINFIFGLGVIALFLVFFKITPDIELVWLPVIMIFQLFFMLPLALLAAYLSVFIRDFEYLVDHIMRMWFFASPVIWRESMFPEKGRWLLTFNPMTHFLAGYRDIIINHTQPEIGVVCVLGCVCLAIAFALLVFYHRNEHHIVKEL